MITRVRLKNWKSHENSEIEFGEGINVIIGRMGAGKSSILDAISLALFGTFPDLQSRKVSLDDLIMSRGKVKNSAEVEVGFSVGGSEYSVMRRIERGKGIVYAELRENGSLLLSPLTKKVTSEVEQIIGMDYDTFSRAVYGDQNNIDEFLRMGRGERKKRIDRLMGLDKYDSARENGVRLLNMMKTKRDTLASELARFDRKGTEKMIREKEARLMDMEREMKSIGKKRAEMEELKKELSSKLSVMEKSREELIAERERLKALERRIAELRKNIVEMEKEIGDAGHGEKVAAIGAEIADLRKKKDGLFSRARELESSIASLSSEISRLEDIERQNKDAMEEIELLRKSLPPEADIGRMKVERDGLVRRKAYLEREIAEIERFLGELEKAEGKCPVCLSPLDSRRKDEIRSIRESEKAEREAELERVSSKLRELSARILQSEKSASMRERILARISQLEKSIRPVDISAIEERKGRIALMEKEKAGIDGELGKISERISALEAVLEEERKLAEMEKRIAMLKEELEKRLADASESAKRLGELEKDFNEEEYMRLRNRLIEVEKSISALGEKAEGLSQLKKEVKSLVDSLRSELERHERTAEEIGFLEYAISFLSQYIDGLVERQKRAREAKVSRVNQFMDDVWQNLYPYDDFISARINVSENDYILELFDGEKWVKVDGIASGGERMLASLAMRISLSLLFSRNLRFIFLDEPTHNLDENAVKLLSEVLKTRITDYVGQVIVITHDELMEEAATSFFYRIEKRGMISRVLSEDVGDI